MEWLRRIVTSGRPGSDHEPAAPIPAEIVALLDSEAINRVRRGFEDEDQMVELIADVALDEHRRLDPARLEAEARAAVRKAVQRHERDERNWAAPTDCDRLDAAFATLEADGILCRQDFSCCGTCGASDIAEIEQVAASGRAVSGYTFYHSQDTDDAAEGEGLYLAFGANGADKAAHLSIGNRVAESLREQGLSPDWSGNLNQRIFVPMVWRRRRASRQAWGGTRPQRLLELPARRTTGGRSRASPDWPGRLRLCILLRRFG